MNRQAALRRILVWSLAALLLALLLLPLLALVLRTFMSGVGQPIALFEAPVIQAALLSLGTTALSTGIIVLLGTPLAYVFARYHFPFRSVFNVLIELPIVMPPVVAGLALLMAFGRRGLLGVPLAQMGITLPFTSAAVVIAQIFVASPFFIRTVQTRFAAIPREIEEAASIDGADTIEYFMGIALPLSKQALLVGLILAWARALGEFGATILFAGSFPGRTQTLPLLVYGALENDLNAALWAGLLLIAVALIALSLMRWIGKRISDGDTEIDPLAGR